MQYKKGKLYNADGSEFKGKNKFGNKVTNNSNRMSESKNGKKVLDELTLSKSKYTFVNELLKNAAGKVSNALFEGPGISGGPLIFYNYKYDQLNRLVGQDAYNNFQTSTNGWDSVLSMGERLKERIMYDANGNILK